MATFGTFTAGQVLTASELNAAGAYTNISATQTFSGFTKGNATVVSQYTKFNKLVHFWGFVILGSTSAITGPLDITLPATAVGGVLTNNSMCSFFDASANFITYGSALHINTSAIRLTAMVTTGNFTTNADVFATVPIVWATGDYFFWNHVYEAA